MVTLKRIIILIIIICFNGFALYASEITEGNIRLVVNEKTGGFSLYYRGNPQVKNYEALFNTEQPASFASVYIDGSTHRLGDRIFKTIFEKENDYPVFVHESSSVTVTQTFTPVMTGSSSVVNGIQITFTVLNTDDKEHSIGFRFLLDTELGEGLGRTPFSTATMNINNERNISNAADAKYWISKNNKASLMGSIINPVDSSQKAPDSVFFANWKRFFDTPWQIRYSQGRSFGGDSAVCYYYEPAPLAAGRSFTYTIFLTAEDPDWYGMTANRIAEKVGVMNESINTAVSGIIENIDSVITNINNENFRTESEEMAAVQEINLPVLYQMQDLLNQFINGEIELDEQNLNEIENAIKRYRQP